MTREAAFLVSAHDAARLRADLAHLVDRARPAALGELETARAEGDLRENAGYEAARDRLRLIDSEIAELSALISRLQVLGPTTRAPEMVELLGQVTVRDAEQPGELVTLTLVSGAVADPLAWQISQDSPVGRALLGQRAGITVTVAAPAGRRRLTIVALGGPAAALGDTCGADA